VKNKCNYILFLGTVFNEEAVLNIEAISPAGNKWQTKFISSIQKNEKIDIICIGHRPERAFPRGKLLVGSSSKYNLSSMQQILVPYLNLLFLRNFMINFLLIFQCTWLIIKRGKPAYILTYNIYHYNFLLALYCKYVYLLKWIYILADPVSDKTGKYHILNKLADAHIYLSYGMYNESKKSKKIHIDGGIDIRNNLSYKSQEDYILYTGRISEHNGIELLLDSMKFLKKNTLLKICGKGHNHKLIMAVKENDNIKYLGIVSEKELDDLIRNATILINPRLIKDKTNNAVFPSKLLEYISYKKPIISTKTYGISDEYKGVIEFIHSDDPIVLANKIDEVLLWDLVTKEKRERDIEEFIISKKNWSILAERFTKWIIN
jgi:glycosyltransferase involved in cell wall biosynthesis